MVKSRLTCANLFLLLLVHFEKGQAQLKHDNFRLWRVPLDPANNLFGSGGDQINNRTIFQGLNVGTWCVAGYSRVDFAGLQLVGIRAFRQFTPKQKPTPEKC